MAAVAHISRLLGGESLTGRLRSERDVVSLARRGVPTDAFDHFLKEVGFYFNAIEPTVMPRRTFERRKRANEPLTPTESDRLLRLVRLVAQAQETVGDADRARNWLGRQNRALGGSSPIDMADTDEGARAVETLLGRIDHGIAA